MADFLDEIRDDYQSEQFRKAVKRAVPVLAALVIALFGGMAAWNFYQSHTKRTNEEAALTYQALQEAADKKEIEAVKPLVEKLVKQGTYGYPQLAKLKLAELYYSEGKKDEALAIYNGLYESSKHNRALKDMAGLLAGYIRLENGAQGTPDASLPGYLATLANGSPFHYSALELQALSHLQLGDNAKAAELFRQIATAPYTPDNLRSRAGDMQNIMTKTQVQ